MRSYLKKVYQKLGLITILLFVLIYLLDIALIISSLHRPLWNDEATRADFINLNFHLASKASQANAFEPIPLSLYLLDKFLALFANTNFIYRLSSYLALLALPAVGWSFCKKLLNKATADLMLPITAVSAYIVDFATQGKPYVLDIVCVLLFVLAYVKYKERKLKLRYFIPTSILLLATSFAAFFVLPIIGLLMLRDCLKTKRKTQLLSLGYWAGGILVFSLMYYLLFLRIQLNSNQALSGLWASYMYMGSIGGFLKNSLVNIETYFNLQPNATSGLHGIYNAWWLNQSLSLKFAIDNIQVVLSYTYLVLFVIGVYYMLKNKKYIFLVCLFGLLAFEWLAALLKLWPFGEVRTNLFSTYLVTIVPYYAVVTIFSKLKGYYRSVLLAVLLIAAIITFPYQYLGSALTENSSFVSHITYNYMGYSDEEFAKIIAASSKPNDLVLIDFYSNPAGLQYYYQFSSYIKHSGSQTTNLDYSSNLINMLAIPNEVYGPAINRPKTIWLIHTLNQGSQRIPSVITKNYTLKISKPYHTQVLLKYSLKTAN